MANKVLLALKYIIQPTESSMKIEKRFYRYGHACYFWINSSTFLKKCTGICVPVLKLVHI